MKSIDEFINSFEENAKQEEESINGWLGDGWQKFFLNLTPEKEKVLWEERKQRAEESREQAKNLRNLAKWLRQAKECTTGWIPVKWHNITEEERDREEYPKDWLTILDCQMPNDGEEVLVTVKGRNGNLYVETDTCYFDGICYSSDSGYDWIDDVVAWMPLPEPYKAESEDK